MKYIELGKILEYEQPTKYLVETTNYSNDYNIPVLTAGQTFILGYTNETKNVFPIDRLPVIIFDDFTTASKFVDFPFKVKSTAMKILNPIDGINIKYVFYAMQKIKFDNTLHKRYWISQYANIKIPLPEIKKQNKIVEELDSITEIISCKKQQIKILDNLIKSQFVEMFENEKRYVNLEEVCIFINGDRGKNYPSADKISKDSKGVPFINAGLLTNNTVDWENMNYISEETYNKLGSGKIQKDDILYCLRGSLGKHAIIDFDDKGAIASSLVILRADQNKIQSKFLLIQLGMDEIIRQQNLANNGSSQPNLSASSVKKYRIKLPDIEMQNKFVNIVKQIDKQKFVLQKSYISMMK